MGEESKLVIMGDTDQIDLKLNKNDKCGLDDAWERLQNIDGIGFVEFSEDDIVRDPFLIEIMKRYKQ
jgi:phosphate starvation-inducible PhoH-like protein